MVQFAARIEPFRYDRPNPVDMGRGFTGEHTAGKRLGNSLVQYHLSSNPSLPLSFGTHNPNAYERNPPRGDDGFALQLVLVAPFGNLVRYVLLAEQRVGRLSDSLDEDVVWAHRILPR